MAIVLIGFMGAGKSTAARELAAALGDEPALDTDELLAQRFGHPVAEEFERSGEEAFRAAEEELVLDVLDKARPEEVIALGGGSVLSERVRRALDGEATVLLDIDVDTAWERVSANGAAPQRPLAADRESFRRLHAERGPVYERLAAAVLGPLPRGAFAAIAPSLTILNHLEGRARLLWATAASGDYPVLIGEGLLREEGPRILESWPLDRAGSRAFVVTDGNVAERYAGRLGETAMTVTINPGEQSKTLASAQRVWTALAAAGMTRADHVVALGGGVVGDLGGFCAATYQRGVPVVQVPSSLVAQVDSAYGGKAGIDLPAAKNYVGAYHQPAGVLADPSVAGAEPDAETIFACVRTKLAIVAADERDSGPRQLLNLGHTVGHAIETATGYARYRHGEAVGLGLLVALRLSGQDALRDQVRELLAARGLPVRLEGVAVEDVLAAVQRDKKRLGAEVPFVLLDGPGRVAYGRIVPEAEVRAAIEELAR